MENEAVPADGARVFREKKISTGIYDVVVCHSREQIVSLLWPVDSRIQERKTYYESMKLTRREMEIMVLKDRGLKHKDICAQLYISLPTLKTHLQRIRAKLR